MLRIKVWLQAITAIALIVGALYLSEMMALRLDQILVI